MGSGGKFMESQLPVWGGGNFFICHIKIEYKEAATFWVAITLLKQMHFWVGAK